MVAKKSKRNKTIDFSLDQGQKYLDRAVKLSKQASLPEILNRSLLGDSFDILPLLPEAFVDLMIVDPPYNLTKNYHGNVFNQTRQEEYIAYTERWIEAVKPLLKEGASLYVCCDWQSSMLIGPVLADHFHIQNRITWQREKGRGAKHNWKNSMEDIWFVTPNKDYYFDVEAVKVRRQVIAPYKQDGKPKDWEATAAGNFRDTHPSNFWDDITVPFWSMPENTAHPTQKPEKLIAKLILASSQAGDLVFDPFMGSGTTSVVAKKLDRRYVGLEFNPQYVAWAEKRLEMAEADKTIQGYTDGVFWERNSGKQQASAAKKKDER